MTQLQSVQISNSDSEELAPWLLKSPRIVQQLGLCVTIAGTRDVAQIRLDTHEYADLQDDVASNLIDIADRGGGAFQFAYSSLSDISSVTKMMSKDNGLLDKLEERMIGARTEKDLKACQTVINRIDSYIERSTEHGRETQSEFTKFADLVMQVRSAITNAQSHEHGNLMDTQRNIEQMGKEKTLQEKVLEISEKDAQQAAEQYGTALDTANGRAKWLGRGMTWTVGTSTIGAAALGVAATAVTGGVAGVAVLGGLIASAVSADQLSKASTSLNIAEDRLNEKRKAYAAMELQLASFEGQLKLLESSKKTLAQASTTIATALNLLNGLVDDIGSLMIRFRELNQDIRKLVDEYGEGKGYAEAILASIEDGEEPDQRDTRDFKSQISEMRKISIQIQSYSSLYASVIRDVIIPGFGQVIETSNQDILNQNVQELVESKRAMTRSYVEESERKCRVMAKKSSVLMAKELARARQLENRPEPNGLGR